MESPQREAITAMYQRHHALPFPRRWYGTEPGGVCMVLLDTYVVECVLTWLESPAACDSRHVDLLLRCLDDLDIAQPELTDPAEVHYGVGLREMVVTLLPADLRHLATPWTSGSA